MERHEYIIFANEEKTEGLDLSSKFSFIPSRNLHIFNTRSADDPKKALEDILLPGRSYVVVTVGTDGTLHGVANATLERDNEIYAAVVPHRGGKRKGGNDIGRPAFNIDSTEEGIAAIKTFYEADNKQKLIRNVDVGEFKAGDFKEYWLNTAGTGFTVEALKKREILNIGYTFAGLLASFMTPYEIRVWLNGTLKVYDSNKFKIVNINNGPEFGDRKKVAYDALFDDGYFNVTLLRDTNFFNILRILLIIQGNDLKKIEELFSKSSAIKYYGTDKKITSLKLETSEPLDVQLDGEIRYAKDMGELSRNARGYYVYEFRVSGKQMLFVQRV